jgi:hypothetical protein
MKIIDDNTPVSELLDIKIGENISYQNKSGVVEKISFEETNNYWEMIFTLTNAENIYVRKQKIMC